MRKYFSQIIDRLSKEQVEFFFTSQFAERNKALVDGGRVVTELAGDFALVFSLGGDGTFLESVLLVGEKEIPIIGINMGRLGFLASIAKDYIKESLYLLFKGNYVIEQRSLISIESNLD